MSLVELQAIIPILIVTATALITLAVEAFRGPDEKLPLGVLGLIGLAGAGVASVMLWGRDRSASASCAPTTSRCSSTCALIVSAS